MGFPSVKFGDRRFCPEAGIVLMRVDGRPVVLDKNGARDASTEEVRAIEATRDLALPWGQEDIDERLRDLAGYGFTDQEVTTALFRDAFRLGTIAGFAAGWHEGAAGGRLLAERLDPDAWDKLTPYQRRIAAEVAAGKTQADIAEQMNLKVFTIRYHLQQAAAALGMTRRELTSRLRSTPGADEVIGSDSPRPELSVREDT